MSKPVELAPNVYRIGTMGSAINSVLFVESNGELTLVDAGLKRAPRSIVSAVESLGKKPSDVTRIVLTHAHPDHAGGLKRMQDRSGARVIAHEVDAPYVESGKAPARDQRNFLAKVLGMLPGNSFAPCHVDEQIADGQLLDVGGGLRVVHTPGHSPGHVSLLHEPSGVLIVGDALFNTMGITFSLKLGVQRHPAVARDGGAPRRPRFRGGDLHARGRDPRERARPREGVHRAQAGPVGPARASCVRSAPKSRRPNTRTCGTPNERGSVLAVFPGGLRPGFGESLRHARADPRTSCRSFHRGRRGGPGVCDLPVSGFHRW